MSVEPSPLNSDEAVGFIEAPTAELASITTGFMLVQPFSRVHALVEKIAGFPVWTHQIPRVSKEIAARVTAALPGFPVAEDAKRWPVNADTYKTFAADVESRFGKTVSIAPLNATPRDPVEEIVAMKARPSADQGTGRLASEGEG